MSDLRLQRWRFECRKCHALIYVHKRKPYAKANLYGWTVVNETQAQAMANELGWNDGICELCAVAA